MWKSSIMGMTENEQIEATMACLREYKSQYGSDLDLDKVRIQFKASAQLARERETNEVNKMVRGLKSPDELQTQLITLSVDQGLTPENAILAQKKAIALIKQSKYKWIQNASYTFEYFSKEGWNPHIHIKTDRKQFDSQIAQMLRRKKIPSIYNINVSSKTEDIHTAYIMGDKKETKREAVEKDGAFREMHGLPDFYLW